MKPSASVPYNGYSFYSSNTEGQSNRFMRRSLYCQPILALVVILGCFCISSFAVSGGNSKAVASSSLPSAPEPSLTLSTHSFVRHPAHVTVPQLDAAPKLSDFLVTPPASPAARQMLRVRHFIQRNPEDGKPSTEQ